VADQPQRPRFQDGRALAAADLDLVVDHARDREARHDRALHTPGIAVGLELRSTDLSMSSEGHQVVTKQITVTAGIATDGNGTQAVLSADQPLSPDQFIDDIGSGSSVEIDPDYRLPNVSYPYPVLLTASDRDGPPPAFSGNGCGGGSGPTRVVEDVQVRIGRRGEHLTLAAQRPLGPGEALVEARPFRTLLGFVRFHSRLERYVEVLGQLDNIRPRRAGVRAGEVVTGDDRLLLRVGEPAAPGQPAMILETTDGGRLRFGTSTAEGGVKEVLTVSARGDLTVQGKIDPGLQVGTNRVQSGTATDGMPLPLPPGVTAKQVQDGDVVLHVQVTPRYPQPAAGQAFLVVRCEVDRQRVVHCRLRRLTATNANTPVPVAACDFLIVAAVVKTPAPGTAP
jgi:hypothetical protein